MKKIILAFSGGLDTSFCVPYLKKQGYEIITITINTGGFSGAEIKEIEQKSKDLGAIKHYYVDAQADLYQKFAGYIIKANYLKGGVYPACVGPERNVIAEKIAEISKKEGVNIIAHGSTGAGNDQVRFELAMRALIPNCEILAPIRENELTRQDEVDFLKKEGIEVSSETKDYSVNVGLLGTTIGGKEMSDSKKELPASVFPTVKENAEILDISVYFEKGLPTKLNGKKMEGMDIIKELNQVCAAHGFGKDYHIGTTIIGIKARIAFEAPAMKLLIKAHGELEKIILTSKQIFWKNHLGNLYGDLVHEGLYYDPLAKDLEAFFDSASQKVAGEVKMRINNGNLTICSLESENSLLGKNGTYGEETGAWNGRDAEGFCKLYGMESVNAFNNEE